jgi:hypothetical protein
MLDQQSFAYSLKQIYPTEAVENLVYKTHPFLALLKKDQNFRGLEMKQPVQYADVAGRSRDFGVAQANKAASKGVAFLITRALDFGLASIDYETLKASEGNSSAFMSALKSEMDKTYNVLSQSLAMSLFGTGSGSRGQIDASTVLTGAVLVLKNADDVVKFEQGMKIVASTTDGGGSLKTVRTIIGVDRDLGTVTFDSNLNSGSAWASQDFLFAEGDHDKGLKGLRAWIPDAPPTNALFFGVDRTADVTRLSGIRFDGSNMPIEEALIKAASRIAREGGSPDVVIMSFSKYVELETALGSKVQYVDIKADTKAMIGFKGIMINGPTAPIKIVPDRYCPSDRAFMLQMDTWCLHSLENPIALQDADGQKILRESNANGVEVRFWSCTQLVCKAPGYNANIYLG